MKKLTSQQQRIADEIQREIDEEIFQDVKTILQTVPQTVRDHVRLMLIEESNAKSVQVAAGQGC